MSGVSVRATKEQVAALAAASSALYQCRQPLPDVTKEIRTVEIADNRSGMKVFDREVDMMQYQKLLDDPGQVDCPLLGSLGFPVILVSTTPGQKCIPQVRMFRVLVWLCPRREQQQRQAYCPHHISSKMQCKLWYRL